MEIVDAPRPCTKTKRDLYRQTAQKICGKAMAAKFDTESEMKDFCKTVRDMGQKPQVQKLSKGGWKVWL